MDPRVTVAGVLVIIFSGLWISMWYGRHTKRFLWREYFAIAFLPSLAVVWAWYRIGNEVLYVYAIACLTGPILEYSLGKAYHITLGERLWKYRRLSIGGHTSLLIVPYWGLVGVCVVTLTQYF